jgi:hypothetical protein
VLALTNKGTRGETSQIFKSLRRHDAIPTWAMDGANIPMGPYKTRYNMRGKQIKSWGRSEPVKPGVWTCHLLVHALCDSAMLIHPPSTDAARRHASKRFPVSFPLYPVLSQSSMRPQLLSQSGVRIPTVRLCALAATPVLPVRGKTTRSLVEVESPGITSIKPLSSRGKADLSDQRPGREYLAHLAPVPGLPPALTFRSDSFSRPPRCYSSFFNRAGSILLGRELIHGLNHTPISVL